MMKMGGKMKIVKKILSVTGLSEDDYDELGEINDEVLDNVDNAQNAMNKSFAIPKADEVNPKAQLGEGATTEDALNNMAIQPSSFKDCKYIAREISKRKTLIINIETLKKKDEETLKNGALQELANETQRFLDFISGACRVVNSRIMQVGGVLLVKPEGQQWGTYGLKLEEQSIINVDQR